jgi:hypothetical protein
MILANGKFKSFMTRLIAVFRIRNQSQLDAEKKSKKRKAKRASASRASGAKD